MVRITQGEGWTRSGDDVYRESGKVGIGTSSPDGSLHVHNGSSGTVTATAGADDLVVEVNGAGGISILTPDASSSNFIFGSPTDSVGAWLNWNHDSNLFEIRTHKTNAQLAIGSGLGSETIRIDASQKVGIGTTTPATSAKLEIDSTTGALLVPRMTTAQKNALTGVNGMIVYDSTLNKFQGYENGSWTSFI